MAFNFKDVIQAVLQSQQNAPKSQPQTATQSTTPQQEAAQDPYVPREQLPSLNTNNKQNNTIDNQDEDKDAEQDDKAKDKKDSAFRSAIPNPATANSLSLNMNNPDEEALALMGPAGGYYNAQPPTSSPEPGKSAYKEGDYWLSPTIRDYAQGDYLLSPLIKDYVQGDYLLSPVFRDYMNGEKASSGEEEPAADTEEARAAQDFLDRYSGWNDLTQREQFNKTMFDDDGKLTEFGQAIVNDFGDAYSNEDNAYEEWRGSDNRDLTSRLYGYDGNQGIRGWQDMARRSGVEDLDGMMDYMWGEGNTFDPLAWIQDKDYAANGRLGYSDDAAAALANYMFQDPKMVPQGIPVTDLNGQQIELSSISNPEDIGVYALAAQMAAEANANDGKIDLNRYDVDRLNDILNASGEGYMLGQIAEGNGFEEKEGAKEGAKPYTIPMLFNGQTTPYTVANGNAGNLDANELDTIITLLNASQSDENNRIGVKGR